ncbi:hypothetical protein B5F30_04300 [Lactobacillus johnsonii]|uniref:mucin-binding protein n=1 Tax=Lactobacillus johnsonii TaxID=33959 RepID=UPI000B3A7EA5|nr:YSIRK-type signal peptide-containing protein [Lactobacillus johnsonii]OUP16182.1 hypothetical protein B5F30_04300 [Lactobacillus johnsonii]
MFSKEQLQRFSIRKLTVGTASVLIGVSILTSWNTNKVYADSGNVTSGVAKNNNPQEGTPAVNKDNAQIVDNGSTEASESPDSNRSNVIKSDATNRDNGRDKSDNSRTTEPTAQTNNKQALTTVTEYNGAKVSKIEKYSNSDIKNQFKNFKKTQETTLAMKVLDKEELSPESLIEEKLSSIKLSEKLDGKIEIPATDPSNYPTELNGLIGKDNQVLSDKYIYQVLSLDGDSGSKLILSVNRNDHNDKNIYAYVTDGNYEDVNYESVVPIGMYSTITIDGRKYWLDNNGSSEVSIKGNKVSTQNSSTVTSEPRDSDNNPISQDYGLGNISKDKCSDIGEIVPVFTENSVIKYYYRDNKGHLQEFKNSEQYPNVIVKGFTGQEFEIKDVDQYKQVIQGYYLTSDNLPTGDFKGTLSQFNGDKYYKKVYYDFDTGRVENSVVYHQISPDGTMEVWLADGNGYPLTKSTHIAPNTSTPFKLYIDYGEYTTEHNIIVRNPYVTAAPHEVQFIYKKLGSIIPVDENGTHIGVPIQFKNDPTDPTKALPGIVPSISGYTPLYKLVGEKVYPTDPGENIEVVYSANAQHMTITYIDDTTGKTLKQDKRDGISDQDTKYTTGDSIKQYEDQHYKLVSDSTNGQDLIFDHDDKADQTYEVHFVHGTQNVSRQDTVTSTIDYKFEDGKTAQPTVTQTKHFSEDGVKDLVTGKIAWDEATPQKFDDVATPAISGYTPDKDNVAGSTVKFGDKDVKVTVTYHNNVQKAVITYVDDVTNKTLAKDSKDGKFNQAIIFEHDPADVIKGLEEKGYKLVSNDFNSNKYQADDSKNVFYVHLNHGIVTVDTNNPQTPNTPINPNDPQSPKYPNDISNTDSDVKRTIDYKFKDGKTAQPTVNDSLHFERTVVIDKVTGDVSSDTWTQSQDFNDIQTPAIQGYTPDKTVVSDKNIGHDHQDIIEHVVYSPDAQHMTITYVDDTAGKTLHTDKPDGVSDQDANYTTSNTIKQYTDLHYKLVSDSTKGQDLIFDHDDKVDQTYYVHFVHGTHTINQTTSPKQTIHYVYADGLARQGKVADDNVQQLSFKRDGYNDEVTGKIAWDEAKPQKFDDVTTPAISGYTPDKDKVAGSTVKFGDKDIEVTVTYHNNAQKAVITYVDDVTNKTLASDSQDGKFDYEIIFEHDPAEVIKGLEEKGYKLVSNDFNNNKYQADNSNNVFYVHFVHDTKKVSQEHSASFTVHYIYKDGKQAKPDHEQTLSFTENGIQDLVTQKITWTPADSQKFDDVVTPAITSYTPDQDKVAGQTANFDTQDRKVTVTYSPDIQLGRINYIDDNTGKTLTHDDFSGRTNEHEDYTPIDRIQEFENKGYELVSNDYPDGGFNFDDNDQQDQVFNVHLKHGTTTVTPDNPGRPGEPVDPDNPDGPKYPDGTDKTGLTDTVNRTITYVMSDGSKAPEAVHDSLSYTVSKVIDKVTGEVLETKWSANQDFKDVDSPSVKGYTSDKTVVSNKDVAHDAADITETVKYSADKQKATITYIDDDNNGNTLKVDNLNGVTNAVYIDDKTGKNLKVDNLNGVTNAKSGYTTKDAIDTYTGLGYTLVSDDTNGSEVVFDNDDAKDQAFTVHLSHGTITVTPENPGKPGEPINPGEGSANYPDGTDKTGLTDTVNRTITYVMSDGSKAPEAVHDSLSYTVSKVIDKVTGEVLETKWSANQDFKDVDSPSVKGYTSDKTVVSNKDVAHDAADITETVKYSADKQKATITYIDDKTGKTIETKELEGVSNGHSDYSTSATIKSLENKGYVKVSDDTNGSEVVFDNDDAKDQAYSVHFVHGTKKVSQDHSASFTVHYIYKDGKQAKPDHEQTLSFTENGIQDLVTQKITWTPADSQKFDDVVTPAITSYTPDQDKVAGQTANFDTQDRKVTVTYSPDIQLGRINYIDDNTGKTLTHDDFSGRTNEHEDYTPIDRIQEFENKGYELVSNDYPDGGFNFDDNDQQDQVFNVHLKHGTTTVTPENPGKPGEPVDPDNPDGPKYPDGTDEYQVKRTGTQTIHYVGASDKTPADNNQTFIFTREITFDNVTGNIISVTPWNVQSHTFGNVDTPVIPGYHADKAVAGGATVTSDDLDKVITVTYIPDGNPGNSGDQGDTPTPEPTPEPEPTPNSTPDDQPDSEISSDEHFENVKSKDKLNKTNPKKVDAYKKERKIIKTKIAKQGHTEIAEPIEDKVTRENNVKVVSDPVENKAAEPKLPQTGEADNSIIGLLGMLLVSFAAMFGFDSLHSHDKKHKN